MNWIEDIRPIIEILYFISGIALTVTIFIGLIQLRKLSIEKSIEYIGSFGRTTLPKIKLYQKKILDKSLIEFTDQIDPSFLFQCEYSKEDLDIEKKAQEGAFELANELEIIASAILSGLANKKIAYRTFGKLYCEAVETLYEIICYSRYQENEDLFSNTIKLYTKWRRTFKSVNTPIG